jgi:hypothetical protein
MLLMGKKQIIGLIGIAVLVVGLGIGLYLVQTKQVIKSRASGTDSEAVLQNIKSQSGLNDDCQVHGSEADCTTDQTTVELNFSGLKELEVPKQ